MLLIGLDFRLYAVRENLRTEPESLRGHLNIADRIVCAMFPFQPCFFLKENKTKMMPSAAATAAAVKPAVEISARD